MNKMKKKYQSPSVDILELAVGACVLVGTPGGTVTPPGEGGEISVGSPLMDDLTDD